MAHSLEQADQLQQAAKLIRQAVADNEHAQGVKAVADAAEQQAADSSRIADMGKVQALSGLHVAQPAQGLPPVPPVTYASGYPDRRNGGSSGGGSKLIAFAIFALAGVILLCFLMGWMGWLTAMLGNKADISYVDTKVAKVNTVATAAQATATEAKAGVVALNVEMKDVKAGLAATTLVANEAHTKVNALTPRVDALEKAQAAVNARARQTTPASRADAVRQPDQSGAGNTVQDPARAPRSGGNVWLWHPPEASDANPKACILSAGSGLGLPKRCSSFTVDTLCPKVNKDQWLVCVGGGSKPTGTGVYTMPGVHSKG